ncbi:MAG: hypothetical protein ABIO04_08950 [Ferruginibacter sp.]
MHMIKHDHIAIDKVALQISYPNTISNKQSHREQVKVIKNVPLE